MVWRQVDQRMRFRFGGVVGPDRAEVFWAAVAAVAALFAARLPSNAIKSPCFASEFTSEAAPVFLDSPFSDG